MCWERGWPVIGTRKAKKPPAGIEPATYALQMRRGSNVTDDPNPACKDGVENLASCLALLNQKSPDLAMIVECWDLLPEAVKAGILAMVEASR